VPNGIDTQRFQRDHQARERVRAAWGAGRQERLVGLVARLDPVKGHPTFVEAAALVASLRPGVRFVCVGGGTGDYPASLLRAAEQAGATEVVLWAGEVLDVVSAYSALDVLCLPSWRAEGFPNVIGEGMACGLPAVVTDVGDASLVVADAGRVVAPQDAEQLARAVVEVLDELAASPAVVAARSRQRIVDAFDARLLAPRTVAALAPAAAHRRRLPRVSSGPLSAAALARRARRRTT
jgi:glycosyltransferase involved in cell wall biosynthesis